MTTYVVDLNKLQYSTALFETELSTAILASAMIDEVRAKRTRLFSQKLTPASSKRGHVT